MESPLESFFNETSLAVFWADALWERVAAAAGVPLAPVQQALMAQAGNTEKLAALDAAITRLTADFGSWRVPWGEINRFQRLDEAIVRSFDDANQVSRYRSYRPTGARSPHSAHSAIRILGATKATTAIASLRWSNSALASARAD